MMAEPEPVRRGAGVVNCKSKPSDHIFTCRNWGHLPPNDESQKPAAFLCPHHHFHSTRLTVTLLSLCHSHKLNKNKLICDMRGIPENADRGFCKAFKRHCRISALLRTGNESIKLPISLFSTVQYKSKDKTYLLCSSIVWKIHFFKEYIFKMF